MKTLQHYIVAIIPAYLASYSKLFTCFYNWLWYSNFTMSLSIDQKDWPGLLLCIALPHPFVFGLETLSWRLLMLKFRIWSTTTQTKVCQTRLDLTWMDSTRLDYTRLDLTQLDLTQLDLEYPNWSLKTFSTMSYWIRQWMRQWIWQTATKV